jgi:predicted amidohydrolase
LGDDENFANTVTTELSKKANASDLGALATKDSLTASDVGALPDTTVIPSIEGLATEDYVTTQVSFKQDKIIGTQDQIIIFDENGNAIAKDTANSDDALIMLAECGIIEPAQQNGIIYTDPDGKILNI